MEHKRSIYFFYLFFCFFLTTKWNKNQRWFDKENFFLKSNQKMSQKKGKTIEYRGPSGSFFSPIINFIHQQSRRRKVWKSLSFYMKNKNKNKTLTPEARRSSTFPRVPPKNWLGRFFRLFSFDFCFVRLFFFWRNEKKRLGNKINFVLALILFRAKKT